MLTRLPYNTGEVIVVCCHAQTTQWRIQFYQLACFFVSQTFMIRLARHIPNLVFACFFFSQIAKMDTEAFIMESRCAMTIVFCLFIFGNCFRLIAFANCFLLIAFWCLLFVNWFMLFANFIFYFLSPAFSTIWLVFFNAHRNFAMRNYISRDSNVKFHIMENWSAMLIVNCFLLIAYCILLNELCLLQIAFC